jgi:hypothetical protein
MLGDGNAATAPIVIVNIGDARAGDPTGYAATVFRIRSSGALSPTCRTDQ